MATRRTKTPQLQQEPPADEAAAPPAAPAETPRPAVEATASEAVAPPAAPAETPRPAVEATASEAAAAAPSHPQQEPAPEAAPEPPAATAPSLWQRLLERQLAGCEATIGQLAQLTRQQHERALRDLEKTARLADDTFAWLATVNLDTTRRVRALAHRAAALLPRRAA